MYCSGTGLHSCTNLCIFCISQSNQIVNEKYMCVVNCAVKMQLSNGEIFENGPLCENCANLRPHKKCFLFIY